MTEIHHAASPDERPLSVNSFQVKLDKFEKYIADVTLQNTEASVEEKRQSINDNLRYETFCEQIRSLFETDIKSQDLKAIHRKLSTNPEVKIDWSEVFGYFQTESNQSEIPNEEISVFTVSKRKTIGEAAGDKKRRDIIQAVVYSSEFDYYITVSQKGAISIYNGKLRLQNCIDINESAWMTSCQYLPKVRKVIAMTERSIVIWDHRAKGKNQSNVHIIKPLEHSPQCMCLIPSDDEHSDSLLIGDDAGFINLVRLTHNDFVVKTNKDQKRVLKYNVIDPNSLTVKIVRRRFHLDWVMQVKYHPDIKCFASCSPGDRLSFVIANLKRIHDTQSVSELSIPRGVNAFCYSEKSNIFATGGVDKTIRLWHPNILSRPTGKMIGHLFTIIDIVMNEKDQHVISLSTARVFRVWDIHTLSCLQVFTDSDERSGERRISAMLFDSRRDRLITGSSTIDLWPMTRSVQDIMSVPQTHDNPLTTIAFNHSASQIITVCTESVIKVWEVETGRQMYQIMDAHGSNIEVTAVSVDELGTRMYTGGYDGSLKVWEFSSGQEIKSYHPDETHEEDHFIVAIKCLPENENPENIAEKSDEVPIANDEISALSIEQASNLERKPLKILVIGWNNKMKLFLDDENFVELVYVNNIDDMFEWKIPERVSAMSHTASEKGGTSDNHDENEVVPRKENLLSTSSITSAALSSLQHLLVTGCSNGNVIIWNSKQLRACAVLDLAKAELASSYDSHRHRTKEKFPHRVNGTVALCHKIFRPDPEEVKRRLKLKKKKLMDDEGNDVENEVNKEPKNEKKTDAPNDEDDDDPTKEVDLNIELLEDEHRDFEELDGISLHSIDLDLGNEPIKMVEVLFPPVVASCHQDTDLRFWSLEGEILCSVTPTTRIVSPLTAICCDEYADHVFAADTKGYISVWNVSEFLEKSMEIASLQSRIELIKQIVCWRAHLTKVVSLQYVDDCNVLISASTDGSVRVWYPLSGHYIGYFGQHRIWHIDPNPSIPSSPVLPYDITEGPLNPVNLRNSNKRKPQTKKYEYPLMFDSEKWKPFRRSAYLRDVSQASSQSQATLNVIEIRNKKFFSALVKPKVDKSGLESDKPIDSETGAIFHHLPVYRLKTPPVHPQRTNFSYSTGLIDDSNENNKLVPAVGVWKTSQNISSQNQPLKAAKASRISPRKSVLPPASLSSSVKRR